MYLVDIENRFTASNRGRNSSPTRISFGEGELLFQENREAGSQVKMFVGDAELEFEEVKAMIYKLHQSEADDDQTWDEYFEDMMQSVRGLFMTEERDLLPLIDRSGDA